MKQETKAQILARRKEVEEELSEYLKEAESDFSLDDIKQVIYDEEDQDDLVAVIAMFDNGQDPIELQNIIETINDAWNYFPHKIIGGLSPAEKLLEYRAVSRYPAAK